MRRILRICRRQPGEEVALGGVKIVGVVLHDVAVGVQRFGDRVRGFRVERVGSGFTPAFQFSIPDAHPYIAALWRRGGARDVKLMTRLKWQYFEFELRQLSGRLADQDALMFGLGARNSKSAPHCGLNDFDTST